MFKQSYKIATVWGIPIKIHISLLILMGLFALAAGLAEGPGGIVVSVVFIAAIFVSIALHELGHSFVAIHRGCRVREITLMFIGGAAQMERVPRRPADEILMAAAGPAVSVLLGIALLTLGRFIPLSPGIWRIPFTRLGVQCNAVEYIGIINVTLALFNLFPCFPMDGGRILRAWLTPRTGRLRATMTAVRWGKGLSLVMGLTGIFYFGNLFLLFIAIFIYTAAENELRMVQFEELRRRRDMGFSGMPPPPPGAASDDGVVIGPPPYDRRDRQYSDLEDI